MRQSKKPTIKEFRESLVDNPVLQFDFIRARELPTHHLQEFLYPLNHSFDYLDIFYSTTPNLDSDLCLPVKQLRGWMQSVTAETIHISLDTSAYILHVYYYEDGVKGHGQFKFQSPIRDPKGFIIKCVGRTESPIPVTSDSVFSISMKVG